MKNDFHLQVLHVIAYFLSGNNEMRSSVILLEAIVMKWNF